jgi:hypothetical protein
MFAHAELLDGRRAERRRKKSLEGTRTAASLDVA